MRDPARCARLSPLALALTLLAACAPDGGGGGGDDPADRGPLADGALDAAEDAAGDAAPDGAAPRDAAADGEPDPDRGARPDAAMPPDGGPPGCAADTDCADPLAETCTAGACGPNPCAVRLFTFDPRGAEYASVHVAGDFNGWPAERGAGLQMQRTADGLWWAKRRFDNGEYQYKFVLYTADGGPEWIRDPQNPLGVDDGFGGMNSVLAVECAECEADGDCGEGVCIDRTCHDTVVCEPGFDWRDAVMYFAMVDRFFDADGRADPVPGADGGPADGPSAQYMGGDLAGVTEKMPYLADLGVTALWITAPFENRDGAGAAINPAADPHRYSAYHGYWPSPANIVYDGRGGAEPRPRVESRIGTDADLRAMVEAAHGAESADGRGIKVLFDYVMNHVDIDSGLYAAHPDWWARDPGRGGVFRSCGIEDLWEDDYWGTRCAFTDYLPPFAFDEAPDALRWSIEDAAWWAAEYGIDGYRLDAIKHVPLQWLTALVDKLEEVVADPPGGRFYLVGETFDYFSRDNLARFVEPGEMLDGQFDFPFKRLLCEAVFRPDGDLGAFADWMDGNDGYYGPDAIMTTWIGNHDIPRAIHFASGQIANCSEGSFPGNGWTDDYPQPADAAPYERLGLAFAVMMTNPGIPLIYYGDEIGLAGGGDPDNRRMMVWDDAALNPAQIRLRAQVRQLARLRARYPSLGRGQRITHRGTGRDVWIYTRFGCGADRPLTVVINKADAEREAELPAGRFVDLLDDQAPVDGGRRMLPPRSVMVLRPALVGR